MGSNDQKRAFLAVILSGIVLFAWQAFVVPKQSKNPVIPTKTIRENNTKNSVVAAAVSAKNEVPKTNAINVQEFPKIVINLKNGNHSVSVSSDLFIMNFVNPNEVKSYEAILGNKKPFKIQLLKDGKGVDISTSIKLNSDGKSFEAINESLGLNISGFLDGEGRFNISLNSSKQYLYRFSFDSKAKDEGNGRIRKFLFHSKDVDRIDVGSSEEAQEGQLNFIGIDHYYHLFAFVFKEKTLSRYQSFESGKMFVDTINPSNKIEGNFVFTKKNYDDLSTLGGKLHLSVDFGFFGVLAVPILRGLQFFYKYFPNYGVAIILITLVMRLVTFPLQYKSFKSMKKMQVVQPELKKLKEKYADDPQKMQKETMALFKRAGANPLGGCFPMLLQMPIFFAFYQVLYNAVELVNAPFILWIIDLSEKDPYYVLPVLMGISMFFQSKLNPSATADATQQKVMMFMPIIFTFIMKDFPAGLNLYIFVSTLFGIAQQLLVYRSMEA